MRVFNESNKEVNIPLNANYNGYAYLLKYIYLYSIVAKITGTPNGSIMIQASNDPETNDTMPNQNPQPAPSNWVTIQDSTFSVTTSGETFYNVTDVAYNYVRIAYTDGSGGTSTATMTITFNGKGM